MARKSAKRTMLADMTPLQRTWAHYEEAQAAYEEAWDVANEAWGPDRLKGGRRRGEPRDPDMHEAALAEIDNQMTRMFAAYDAWDRTRKKETRERHDGLVMLTSDALAATDTGQHFRVPLEDLADALFPVLTEYDARDEHVGEPPLCPDCREEMLA